jgi:hypothetical protein
MNCEKYLKLTPLERSMKIGMVIHCLQNDNALFDTCEEIIKLGNLKGLFDNVTFHPTGTETRTNDPKISNEP